MRKQTAIDKSRKKVDYKKAISINDLDSKSNSIEKGTGEGVVMLDILGFKNKILKQHFVINCNDDDAKRLKKINDDFILYCIEYIDEILCEVINNFDDNLKVLTVSDSLYLFNIKLDDNLLQIISVYFILCTKFNFYFRGGASFESYDTGSREGIFVGKGIIESYELEEENSVNPRVILPKYNIKDLNKISIKDYMKESTDGFYEIDYIKYTIENYADLIKLVSNASSDNAIGFDVDNKCISCSTESCLVNKGFKIDSCSDYKTQESFINKVLKDINKNLEYSKLSLNNKLYQKFDWLKSNIERAMRNVKK